MLAHPRRLVVLRMSALIVRLSFTDRSDRITEMFTNAPHDAIMARQTLGAPFGAQVVTVASGVGCCGDDVAALVAAQLGLPLLDSIVVRRAAAALDMPVDEAMALDGLMPSPILTLLACTGLLGPSQEGYEAMQHVHVLARLQVEMARAIRDVAADGGVLVGRAGAMVLADHALALHIRLDTPPEARVCDLVERRGVDANEVASIIRRSDRAAARYVRRAHRANINDDAHYDLVLDPSTLGCEHVANVIVTEARCRWANEPVPYALR
jgi:cytidylate kinase